MGEYYGAQFVNQGFSDFNNALARAFDDRERKQEEAKRRAQYATSLRKTLDLMNPEGKDARAAGGLPDLEGELQARIMQAAEKQKAAQTALENAHLNALLQQAQQEQAGQRFYGEMDEAMQPPAPLNDAAAATYQARATPGMVFGALKRSGYAPGPEKLDQLLRVLDRAGRPQFTPGTVNPVPGLPGYMYGIQNAEGAGSFLPTHAGVMDLSTLPPVPGYQAMPDGKGGVRYLKLDATGLANQSAAEANLEKTLAQLSSMKERGVKTAKVSKSGGANDGGVLGWGNENIDDLIAGVNAELKAMRSKGPKATGTNAAAAAGKPAAEKKSDGPPAVKEKPAEPKTKADFEALPKGTLFVNPADGITYRKT